MKTTVMTVEQLRKRASELGIKNDLIVLETKIFLIRHERRN